jgi:hypothetical protein
MMIEVCLTKLNARTFFRNYLLLKESYFSQSLGVSTIGDGVVMWKGFHVSFRPTSGGLSLNFGETFRAYRFVLFFGFC